MFAWYGSTLQISPARLVWQLLHDGGWSSPARILAESKGYQGSSQLDLAWLLGTNYRTITISFFNSGSKKRIAAFASIRSAVAGDAVSLADDLEWTVDRPGSYENAPLHWSQVSHE